MKVWIKYQQAFYIEQIDCSLEISCYVPREGRRTRILFMCTEKWKNGDWK